MSTNLCKTSTWTPDILILERDAKGNGDSCSFSTGYGLAIAAFLDGQPLGPRKVYKTKGALIEVTDENVLRVEWDEGERPISEVSLPPGTKIEVMLLDRPILSSEPQLLHMLISDDFMQTYSDSRGWLNLVGSLESNKRIKKAFEATPIFVEWPAPHVKQGLIILPPKNGQSGVAVMPIFSSATDGIRLSVPFYVDPIPENPGQYRKSPKIRDNHQLEMCERLVAQFLWREKFISYETATKIGGEHFYVHPGIAAANIRPTHPPSTSVTPA